jgi:hypothetical protein
MSEGIKFNMNYMLLEVKHAKIVIVISSVRTTISSIIAAASVTVLIWFSIIKKLL